MRKPSVEDFLKAIRAYLDQFDAPDEAPPAPGTEEARLLQAAKEQYPEHFSEEGIAAANQADEKLLHRIFDAIVDVDVDVGERGTSALEFMPDECLVYMARHSKMSDRARQAALAEESLHRNHRRWAEAREAALSMERSPHNRLRSSDVERARTILEFASDERRGELALNDDRTKEKKLVDAFVFAWAAQFPKNWIDEATHHGDAAHAFRYHATKSWTASTVEKLAKLTDAQILEAVALWGSDRCKPKNGEIKGSKWDLLATFAGEFLFGIDAEALRERCKARVVKRLPVAFSDLDDGEIPAMWRELPRSSTSPNDDD